MPKTDVAIVGAGIVGLAHALEAARRGRSVTVFERSARAVGASIRNFGMVWPIAQPPGPLFERAMRSRKIWLDAADQAGFWRTQCGSLHVAYHEDEWTVLNEFAARHGRSGYSIELLDAAACFSRSPGLQREGLIGGMWSATECGVDPREAIRAMPAWLNRSFGVEFQFDTTVSTIDGGELLTGSGVRWQFRKAVVCSGEEFGLLFPNELAESGLTRCKLQMLRTAPQPNGWQLGPHLAGGLTLRHYQAFRDCPTLPALASRFDREHPEFSRWGIHVLVSQNQAGELTIGDSHEYDRSVEPFNREEIDAIVLDYLSSFFDPPALRIAERWQGVYPKHKGGGTEIVLSPCDNVWIVNGLGGMGMTLSFGLAQEVWERIEKS